MQAEPGLHGGYGGAEEVAVPLAPIPRVYGYAGGRSSAPARKAGAKRRERGRLIEGEVLGQAGPDPQHRFTAGERVFHQKFGNGNVLAVDGDKLRIAFDHAGEKMVIASFVAPV